jgi:hypothetical protein
MKMYSDTRSNPRPAINVKVYGMQGFTDRIAKQFGCSEDDAQNALNREFESEQENFWVCAQLLAQDILGTGVTVTQEGRSGGWLVVNGLPADDWDQELVSKWIDFERTIEADIRSRISYESMVAGIESAGYLREFSYTKAFERYQAANNAALEQLRAYIALLDEYR